MSRRATALLALLALGACTGGDSSTSSSSSGMSSCPNDLPADCPAPPPSFAKDVAPVFKAYCATCHSPPGREPNRLLTDYAHIQPFVGSILSQVHSCKMPPSNGPALTAEGRKVLQTWLVCGSPDN